MVVTKSDVCVHHPFRMIVSGASGVGKTMFVKKFLENLENISQKFDKIIFSYSVDQSIYEDLKKSIPNIMWIKGLSTTELEEYLLTEEGDKLLVIDDQMVESTSSAFLASLFTKLSHHTNSEPGPFHWSWKPAAEVPAGGGNFRGDRP